MSGEQYLQFFQAGHETVEGTPVAATRRLYVTGSITRDRATNVVNASTGTRDQTVDIKARSVTAGGSLTIPMSADELIEFLLCGIKGGVSPVTTLGASTWTFVPGALDSMTLEFYDGYRAWQENGVKVNSIRIAGSATADNTVTLDLFARDAVYAGESGVTFAAMTAALTERVPDFFEGWESALYIDAFGATPGTTLISNTLISWDFTIANNLGRKYFGDNTTATGKVTTGVINITGQVTFEANTAAMAEYANREAATKRLMRLQFGNNKIVGTGSAKKTVNLDLPGAWTTVDLTPEDQGTKVYRFNFNYVRDPTNAFPVQIQCINARAAAWT
jgi:hypothetical protein